MQKHIMRRRRNFIMGIVLTILSSAWIVFVIWPSPRHAESFELVSAMLPDRYTLIVEYPEYWFRDQDTNITVTITPHSSQSSAQTETRPIVALAWHSENMRFDPSGEQIFSLPKQNPVEMTWRSYSPDSGPYSFALSLSQQTLTSSSQEISSVLIWSRPFVAKERLGVGNFQAPSIALAVVCLFLGILFFLFHLPQSKKVRR